MFSSPSQLLYCTVSYLSQGRNPTPLTRKPMISLAPTHLTTRYQVLASTIYRLVERAQTSFQKKTAMSQSSHRRRLHPPFCLYPSRGSPSHLGQTTTTTPPSQKQLRPGGTLFNGLPRHEALRVLYLFFFYSNSISWCLWGAQPSLPPSPPFHAAAAAAAAGVRGAGGGMSRI